MDGTTWTKEETTELRRLRLDPIRNTPAKLRLLVAHFLKPEASVFAATEGDGPVRVSKTLARKVRDLTLEGALGWVVEDAERWGRPFRGALGNTVVALPGGVCRRSRRLPRRVGVRGPGQRDSGREQGDLHAPGRKVRTGPQALRGGDLQP